MTPAFAIRPAQPQDTLAIATLIRELAIFENLEHQLTGDPVDLRQHLFGEPPVAASLVAEIDREIVGFGLYFTNYSTFLMKPGLYLEDLFVLPEYRRLGIGRALLSSLIQLAKEQGYGRVEWSVLDWNTEAISFYESLGANVLPNWRICRVVIP